MKSTICWISAWVSACLNGGIPAAAVLTGPAMAAFERIRSSCDRSGPIGPAARPEVVARQSSPCDEISGSAGQGVDSPGFR